MYDANTNEKSNTIYDITDLNYDVPITYYYSTDERAINDNKLEEYLNQKSSSYLFKYVDGEYIRSSYATDANIKSFFEERYSEAVSYFKSNPTYIKHVNHSMLVSTGTMLLNGTITCSIYYLLIPILDKKHRSIGMMATKTILVNEDKKDSTKSQVVMRYSMILLMNFLMPVGIYILSSSLVGITWFINMGVICFTKTFDSLIPK